MRARARVWIPAMAVVVGAIAVLSIMRGADPIAAPAVEGERATVAVPDARRPAAVAPNPAPAHDAQTPPPAPNTELPQEGRVYFPGQGYATVVPTDPAQAPAPVDENQPTVESPPIPPEQPQTPEWREAKARAAEGMVQAKLSAMEKEVEQARASGDGARLRRAEAALSRQRALHEVVRAEAASDAERSASVTQ